jgi:hypothetical protein
MDFPEEFKSKLNGNFPEVIESIIHHHEKN